MLNSLSRRYPRLLIVMITLMALAFPAAPGNAAVLERPHYRIDASLDFDNARLSVQQRVEFPNLTGQTLSSIVFNVTPAHFDAIRLNGIAVDNTPVSFSLEDVVLEISLPQPLPADQSTTLSIDYALEVPATGNLRFGTGRGILALGNWYPVLAVWMGGDWDRHRYTDVGDAFFTAVADYDVTLRTRADLIVAHTGDVIASANGIHELQARQARDFAIAVSDRYEVERRDFAGVRLLAFHLPEHRDVANAWLSTAADSLEWAKGRLTAYPYSTLVLAETYSADGVGVGQEYPGIIFIGTSNAGASSAPGGYLSYLVAHEVFHQWFYSLVGNDQIREPWLDEALSTYLPYRFFADVYPAAYPTAWQTVLDRAQAGLNRLGHRPVDSTIYDFGSDSDYFPIVYYRGAVFLEALRQQLGDPGFERLLETYIQRHSHKIAAGADFLSLAQATTPSDLTSLIQQYFRNPAYRTHSQDFPVTNGWFFKQANGTGGQGEKGFVVTDDQGIPFWTEFQRGGGVSAFGYPISNRFDWDGFTVQAFQKAIFQWQPGRGMFFVNVLDRLSFAGKDDWLLAFRQTPRPLDTSADRGLPWESVVGKHVALLDAYPAIKAAYFSSPAWLERYGLPVGAADYANVTAVRCQRAVFQLWKEDVPWAKAGEVTIANGGDLAKETGLLPLSSLEPVLPPGQ